MPEEEKKAAEADAAANGSADDEGDYFYVCKKALDSVREKLKKSEEVTQADVEVLAFPEGLADTELMVPVDMRGAGGDFEDVEQMVEKLGPKGAAEAFVKAADHFEKTKDSLPEDERPKPMTATEWKAVLEEEDDMEGEEEELLEGEEEELGEDGEEEGGDEDKGAEEPAAKKAKKD